jgi:hypothetical protein
MAEVTMQTLQMTKLWCPLFTQKNLFSSKAINPNKTIGQG